MYGRISGQKLKDLTIFKPQKSSHMKSIYRRNTGAATPSDKVGDYNFRQHYPDMNMNLLWASVTPYIRQATDEQILPWIGEAMYNAIADLVESGATLDEVQSRFLDLLRDAVAFHTVARMLPLKKTTIASMGAVENVAAEGTTTTSQWGFRTTLWSVTQAADRATDRLLAYMEAQVSQGNTFFNAWKTDPTFLAGSSDFFRNTADFQAYFNLNDSRRTFLQLLPTIKQAARQHILPAISKAQYEELTSQVANNNLSTENEALLGYVRASLAFWTIYYASDKLVAIPEHGGFRVISNADAVDSRVLPQDVLLQAIDRIKYAAERDAKTNTADLVTFLSDNADDYPLWKASSANPDNVTEWYIPVNGSEHGAVML